MTLGPLLCLFCLGGLSWSLTEYILHRFRGHGPTNGSRFQKEHWQHHAVAGYFTPLKTKVRMAAPILVGLFFAGLFVAGAAPSAAFVLGFGLTYGAYEYTHWRLHAHPPRGRWGRLLRRHHFAHHFHDGASNHGVTSPLWDLVFGTYRPVPTVRVPARHTMAWLSAAAESAERPSYLADYQLRPQRARRRSRDERGAA